MKRIDILGLHLNYGGTEQAIINQANMLCENYDVRLVITYKMSPKPAFGIDKRVKVIYLTNLKPNREEFKKALREKNFLKAIKEGFSAIKILRMKSKTMKQYVKKTPADILISSRLSIHKIVKKYAKKSAIKIGEEHRYSIKDPKYIKQIKKTCKKFDYFVCVSRELAVFYQKILPNVNCIFIPNALSTSSSQNIANYNSKNLLAIGRLSPEKGFDDAIRIMSLLTQKDRNIKLNIIGEGAERARLETEIKKYNLEDNVFLHGFKDQEYIKKIAAASSLYLLTSHEESFGTTIIEAASYGLPTIAFDSAKGATEIIKNNQTGIIIKGRDLNVAANTILRLFKNTEKLTELGQNAFSESKNYNFKNIQKCWQKFITVMLEKTSHPL